MPLLKIGILGAGQLGRMLAQAGEKLGIECRFLDPATEISARGFGEHHCAAFEDVDALDEFRDGLDAVTYEFENVPVESVRWLAQRLPVFPPPEALRVAQDRLFEKTFLRDHGVPLPSFAHFFFRDEYDEAVRAIGLPAVLKTRRFGYDGKGQRVLRTAEDADRAFKELHGLPLFLEGFVAFDRELSILAVRGNDGACAFYPLVENHHREGILRLSLAPAEGTLGALQRQAERHARNMLEKLNYVGVLAIEFFEKDGVLYANEMAPRVHNSGHGTIEGNVTSQFENHLRAVAGMPLGDTSANGAGAMVNLIGEVPPLDLLETIPGLAIHLYGKSPRKGRKLGHLTLCEPTREALRAKLELLATTVEIPHLREILAL